MRSRVRPHGPETSGLMGGYRRWARLSGLQEVQGAEELAQLQSSQLDTREPEHSAAWVPAETVSKAVELGPGHRAAHAHPLPSEGAPVLSWESSML